MSPRSLLAPLLALALLASGCLLGFSDPPCDPDAKPSPCTHGAVCDRTLKVCVLLSSTSTSSGTSATSATSSSTGSGSTSSTASSTGSTSGTTTTATTTTTGTSSTSSTGSTTSSSTSGTSTSTSGGSASFSGVVVLAGFGAGLDASGVQVTLHNDAGAFNTVTTSTGDGGAAFSFPGVPAGTYALGFSKVLADQGLGSIGYGASFDAVSVSASGVTVQDVLGTAFNTSWVNPLPLPAGVQRTAPGANCDQDLSVLADGELLFVTGTSLQRLPLTGPSQPLLEGATGLYGSGGGTVAALTDAGPGFCGVTLALLDGGAPNTSSSGLVDCNDAPSVSPDGKEVVYLDQCGSGSPPACRLEVVSAVASGAPRSPGSVMFPPVFRADSRDMVEITAPMTTGASYSGTLTLTALDGGPNPVSISINGLQVAAGDSFSSNHECLPPQFTPDQTSLVFQTNGNFPTCYVMNFDQAWTGQLPDGGNSAPKMVGTCLSYLISPDSAHVATYDNAGQLSLIDIATGATTARGPALAVTYPRRRYVFTPDGQALYLAGASGLQRWNFSSPLPDAGPNLTLLAPDGGQFVTSPDGSQLAVWFSLGLGPSYANGLELVSAQGAITPVLDGYQQYDARGLVWAPDSMHFAFVESSADNATGPLFVGPTSDGGVEQVASSVLPTTDPSAGWYAFDGTGQTLVFVEGALGASLVSAVPAGGGMPQPLNGSLLLPLHFTSAGVDVNRCGGTPFQNGIYATPLP